MSTAVPQIAVTQEEDNDDDFDNGNSSYLSLAEALTDVEDLDEENVIVKIQKPARKSKLKIKLTHDEALTDLEDFEASSDEDDNKVIIKHATPLSLEDLDLEGGVFEESYKTHVTSRKGIRKFKTQFSTTQKNVEDVNYKIFDNYTDEELFDTENEVLTDTIPENNIDLDSYNLENINVADSSNKDDTKMLSLSPNHSNSIGFKSSPQNNHFLNTLSLSPNLSDITDVEVLMSDSDDEKVNKKVKPRRRKQKCSRRQSLTDVEDLHVSDNDGRFKSYACNPKRKPKKYKAVKKSYSLAYDSDNEDNAHLPFPLCKKIAVKKQNVLNIPEFDTNFPTDTEDFEDVTDNVVTPVYENHEEEFEKRLDAMAECYGKVDESNTSIKTQKIRSFKNNRASEDTNSTDSDNCQSDNHDPVKNDQSAAYDIKFVGATSTIPKKKETISLVVPIQTEEPVTDCENVNSSDDEMSKIIPIALAKQLRMLTDEEEIVDDSDDIDSFPEINLPPPVRNLVILKDNGSLPTVQIVPLEDTSVLSPKEQSLTAETDEESVSEAEEAVEITKSISVTDFNLSDCGVVKETENNRNKSKKLSVPLKDDEDLTDTEELVLNTPKKRRAPKFKYLHERFLAEQNRLFVKTPEPRGLTDTEDLYLSDGNSEFRSLSPLLNIPNLPAPEGFTDVEVVGDSSDDEPNLRALSCTPQQMRELGGEMIMFKEGSGPFSIQDHLEINKPIKIASNFIVSPVNTDTEDFNNSADETAVDSRAETATPNQIPFELNQETDTTIVNESKLKLASEGCMYLKGGGYSDPLSHIEYMSAEEINFKNSSKPLGIYCDDEISFNFRDGSVSYKLQEGWETTRQPLNLEPTAPPLVKDAAQQGADNATSSTSTRDAAARDAAAPSTSRPEGEEGAEKEETEYERRVADQQHLSEEMKELLKELEKETKQ